MAKTATLSLMKNLNHELGPYNIRVNAVAPSTITDTTFGAVVSSDLTHLISDFQFKKSYAF